jgi:aryl-alcohol dehydrogenase-like predicted oxidoreductase
MQYRRLGRAGLRVSALSLGSWVTYHNQVGTDSAVEMMAAAFDGGINFFDNAEGYAGGRSEEIMGQALKRLGWPRPYSQEVDHHGGTRWRTPIRPW